MSLSNSDATHISSQKTDFNITGAPIDVSIPIDMPSLKQDTKSVEVPSDTQPMPKTSICSAVDLLKHEPKCPTVLHTIPPWISHIIQSDDWESDWIRMSRIGKGSYGEIYQVRAPSLSRFVDTRTSFNHTDHTDNIEKISLVVKDMSLNTTFEYCNAIQESKVQSYVWHALKCLEKYTPSNVSKSNLLLLDSFLRVYHTYTNNKANKVAILMDLTQHSSLHKYLSEYMGVLSSYYITSLLMCMICLAHRNLFAFGIIHGDMNWDNVMFYHPVGRTFGELCETTYTYSMNGHVFNIVMPYPISLKIIDWGISVKWEKFTKSWDSFIDPSLSLEDRTLFQNEMQQLYTSLIEPMYSNWSEYPFRRHNCKVFDPFVDTSAMTSDERLREFEKLFRCTHMILIDDIPVEYMDLFTLFTQFLNKYRYGTCTIVVEHVSTLVGVLCEYAKSKVHISDAFLYCMHFMSTLLDTIFKEGVQ